MKYVDALFVSLGFMFGLPIGYYLTVWAKQLYYQRQLRKSFERYRDQGWL